MFRFYVDPGAWEQALGGQPGEVSHLETAEVRVRCGMALESESGQDPAAGLGEVNGGLGLARPERPIQHVRRAHTSLGWGSRGFRWAATQVLGKGQCLSRGTAGTARTVPGVGLQGRPAQRQWSAQRGDAGLRTWAGLATEKGLETMATSTRGPRPPHGPLSWRTPSPLVGHAVEALEYQQFVTFQPALVKILNSCWKKISQVVAKICLFSVTVKRAPCSVDLHFLRVH